MASSQENSDRLDELEKRVEEIAQRQERISISVEQTHQIARQTLEFLQTLDLTPKTNDNHNN
ncbi:MAG: hypothetical protein HC857_13215 [Synechococcales cyanobacterium RU_4_20]|nr:hypothetical protein [Synechococcales cyanobacterium RU_4_20]NJR70875.1 hypothetical protein [Synechococcales cyanobacterium CRU_2_2]